MGIALVAGGTSGVGLATARRLQVRGYDVHLTGRGKERLDDVAASDPQLTGHRADGGDAAAMAALAESLGTVDVLVVCLTGGGGMGPIAELDLATLRRAFDAKFWTHLVTVKAVLPHLAVNGSITLLSGMTARAAVPGTAGIGAVNAAVESLVRPLAVELAPRRVNAVSPGFVDTPWWGRFPPEVREERFARTAATAPVRRVATADDIAEVVALAATNANLSGTVLEADGGAHLVSMD
ncbi:SDR family oxidoreductase [Amycolatopsis ultiminotia]|uniref:SDR family oxidoreductase n=1 Tax=Amycolatopsis ultiminotia TaxID=543629 RepID=A0ABP6V309_9PSEU